jgi:hypothetical protein
MSYDINVVCLYHSLSKDKIRKKLKKLKINEHRINFIKGKNYSLSDAPKNYEFDQYREGVRNVDRCTKTLFINDTAFKYFEYRFLREILEDCSIYEFDVPAIYGLYDPNFFMRTLSHFETLDQRHIRTNMFVVNSAGVDLMEIFLQKKIDMEIQTAWSAPSDEVFEKFLKVDYHIALNSYLRKKRTIAIEYLLTREFYENGVIVPTNRSLLRNAKLKLFNFGNRIVK